MIYTITEKQLCEIVSEAVNRCLLDEDSDVGLLCETVVQKHLGALNEMAFKRKDYKEKIDNESSQIIINWCLVHYCTLFGDVNRCKEHWCGELRGHILTAARYNLKGEKTSEDKEQAIREVWNDNDYFLPKTIEYVIYNKFKKEGLDTSGVVFVQVIADCINSFNDIIRLVSHGDIREISDYVDSL